MSVNSNCNRIWFWCEYVLACENCWNAYKLMTSAVAAVEGLGSSGYELSNWRITKTTDLLQYEWWSSRIYAAHMLSVLTALYPRNLVPSYIWSTYNFYFAWHAWNWRQRKMVYSDMMSSLLFSPPRAPPCCLIGPVVIRRRKQLLLIWPSKCTGNRTNARVLSSSAAGSRM